MNTGEEPTMALQQHKQSNKAATLLEIMIGLALLSIVLIGTAQVVISVHQTNSRAAQQLAAQGAAADQIEVLKGLTTQEIMERRAQGSSLQFPVERVVDGRRIQLKAIEPATLPGQLMIEPIAGGYVIRITATVTWRSLMGPEQLTVVWNREVRND